MGASVSKNRNGVLKEALQVINMNLQPENMLRWKEGLPDDLREEIESYNRPVLLTGG